MPKDVRVTNGGWGKASRARLPHASAPLIARDRDLVRVMELLARPDVRLLTMVGPPGAGKTRLALMTAESVVDRFHDGVWFVDLTPIRDPALVAQAIAAALDIADAGGGRLEDTLKRVLRARKALLILDNFEQVLAAAGLVSHLLESCPQLKVLVTSRAPLHLSAEQQFLVPPLDVPDLNAPLLHDELKRNPAVALFTLRARAVNPTWELTLEEAMAVAELCVRLDGLPLAIELVASWIVLMPARAIGRRLTPVLDLLVANSPEQAQRHLTLRSAIQWSEDLLSPAQQHLFRQLAVFSGGWTLEAAAAVCEQDGMSTKLLEGLALLADHHLILSTAQLDGEPRFRMLATIREYALERLTACDELDAARRRHARYFLGLVEGAERAWHGPSQGVWLDRLEPEYDNLRADLDWCLGDPDPEVARVGLRLGSGLWFFWTVRGHIK